MANLNDDELLNLVNSMEVEAKDDRSTRNAANRNIKARYDGDPYGTEIEGRSSVVSQDVKDLVESDMPGLVRTLLGSESIMKFSASNPNNDKQVKEAAEKTAYVDWIIRRQSSSFRTNYGFIKDIDTYKMGALKYFFEETKSTKVVKFKNISQDEEDEILQDIESTKDYSDFEVVSEEVNEDGTSDLEFKVMTKKQEVKIVGVPCSTLLISHGATSEDDAKLIGDTSTKTRGQLLAEGFKKKVISSLPTTSNGTNSMRVISCDEDGTVDPADFGEWASQYVEISDLYVMIDYDQDGIAERRHIVKSGDVILENEAFDHVPYAIASAILTPHQIEGESRAEQVIKTQEVKTALTRQMLDNGYMANNPKLAINSNVNIDEALSNAIGGVIQVNSENPVGQDIFPVSVPFIGDKSLLLIQHMDQIKANSVGTQMASQGLNADQLTKETATRFEGVRDAAAAKLELVTRIIAEVGYRKLYSGIAWMVSQFQDTKAEFSVLGKALSADPSRWVDNHQIDSEVGLGAGDNKDAVQNLTGLYQVQTQLKAVQSPLVDDEKLFNTLNKLVKALEFKDASQFFNDPSQPEELTVAQLELAQFNLEQLQQQNEILIQQTDNPLAEAEMVKREGEVVIAQGKLELETAKLQEEQRQFNIETTQKAAQQQEELAAKLTELELKFNKQVEGSIV